jgi:hypothetical protein
MIRRSLALILWAALVTSIAGPVMLAQTGPDAGHLVVLGRRPLAPGAFVLQEAQVNGTNVTLNWSAAPNAPTRYDIQAGLVSGQTAVTFQVAGNVTQFFGTAGVGTYFVRIVAVNADGFSVSNEITVRITSGCTPPAAPQNFTAIVRGTEVFLQWLASAGAANYRVHIGATPGTTFTSFSRPVPTLNGTGGAGAFFARVVAENACGASSPSNEVPLTFPSNTVRVPDPPSGNVPLPDFSALVARIAAEQPDLLINGSCPQGIKYIRNPWLDFMVDRLRTYDTRIGYNAKPTKTAADNGGVPVRAAGDEIAYYAGSGNGEGSSNTYLIDILFNHCGPRPEITWRHFTGEEPGIWTGDGRF